MRIVLDTNVLVSGLLSPSGPPGRIVDLATARQVDLLYDDRILLEYEEVLSRPRLRISPAAAAAVLAFVARHGRLVPAPPTRIELPDPDDLPFVEVAIAGMADALVTGNARHYIPLTGTVPVRITTPAEFIAEWRESPALDE